MSAVDDLRRRIKGLEKPLMRLDGTLGTENVWGFGVPAIDAALPKGRLSHGALHEVMADSYADGPAATGFCLGLVRRLGSQGTVLWGHSHHSSLEFGRPYGHGLETFGIDHRRLLFIRTRKCTDTLWAMEEAVRSKAVTAVVGEASGVSFTATRRLSLAAAVNGTPVILLRPYGEAPASAADTRWRVAANPSAVNDWDGKAPGAASWRVNLFRVRGGQPGRWDVVWENETYRFGLVAPMAGRSVQADAPKRAQAL